MSDIFLIIGGIALCVQLCVLLALLIKLIRKKPKKKTLIVLATSVVTFLVFETIGVQTMCKHEGVLTDQIPPTCTKAGKNTYYCDICDKEKYETVPALGHNFTALSRTEPTYRSTGTEDVKCSRCGYEETRTLDKLKCTHQWSDATCTEPKTCSQCGEISGKALGHEWVTTCTAPKTCSRCGETKGAALGHDWDKATCTAPETCSRCGKTNGAALGHKWEEATCTAPETCSRCGMTKGSSLGHDWKSATSTSPKTCLRCGITEGDPIKSEHKSSETSSANSRNDYSSTPSESSRNSARHSDLEAWVCAEKIVKDRLKAPSTAKFCSMREANISHLGNGEYMISGWVDAENSYGAKIRTSFIVFYTATKNGFKNAEVDFY